MSTLNVSFNNLSASGYISPVYLYAKNTSITNLTVTTAHIEIINFFTNEGDLSTSSNILGQASFKVPPLCSYPPNYGPELTTKSYIDSITGHSIEGYHLYFNNKNSDIMNCSTLLSSIDLNTSVIKVTNTSCLIETFITPMGYPYITTIPSGIWYAYIYGHLSSEQLSSVYYYAIVNKTASNGSILNQIGQSINSISIIASEYPYQYKLIIVCPETNISITDRIMVELYCNSSQTNVSLITSFQGDYYSYMVTSLLPGTGLLSSNNDWSGINNFSNLTLLQNVSISNVLNINGLTTTTPNISISNSLNVTRLATFQNISIQGILNVNDLTTLTNISLINISVIGQLSTVNVSATNSSIQYLNANTLNVSVVTTLNTLNVTEFTQINNASITNLSVTGYMSTYNLSATNASIQHLNASILNISNYTILNTLNVTEFTQINNASITNLSVTGYMSTYNLSATNASIQVLSAGILNVSTTTTLNTLTVTGLTILNDASANNISIKGYMSTYNLSAINASIQYLNASILNTSSLTISDFTTLNNVSINNLFIIENASINVLKATNASIINVSVTKLYVNTDISTIDSFTNLSAINSSIVNLSVTNIYNYNPTFPKSSTSIGYTQTGTVIVTQELYSFIGPFTLATLTLPKGVWVLTGIAKINKVTGQSYSISITPYDIIQTNENQIIMY